MNQEDLKYFRKRFQKWKNVRVYHDNLKSKKINLQTEIKELEENPLIQNYLQKRRELSYLVGEINRIKREDGREFLFDENRALIQYGSNQNTNGIYVCMGAYPKHDIFTNDTYLKTEPNFDRLLSIDDKDAKYRIYADIESCYTEVISIKDYQDFENENTVLFPGKEDPFSFYKRVRLLFFKECIENTQEEAIEKVLKLKK